MQSSAYISSFTRCAKSIVTAPNPLYSALTISDDIRVARLFWEEMLDGEGRNKNQKTR